MRRIGVAVPGADTSRSKVRNAQQPWGPRDLLEGDDEARPVFPRELLRLVDLSPGHIFPQTFLSFFGALIALCGGDTEPSVSVGVVFGDAFTFGRT